VATNSQKTENANWSPAVEYSPDGCPPLTVNGFADRYIESLIAAPAQMLERGAVLGRITCHIWMYCMGNVMRIEDESGTAQGAGKCPSRAKSLCRFKRERLRSLPLKRHGLLVEKGAFLRSRGSEPF
jgi:hypothetical protein